MKVGTVKISLFSGTKWWTKVLPLCRPFSSCDDVSVRVKEQSEYSVHLECCHDIGGFFSATTQVMVTIADKNDNTPYFEKLLYEKEVDEQPADSSKSILTVKARDIDDGKFW